MERNWPLLNDYGDALQHPERALYIFEDLRDAEVEMNALRRPKGRSGNFAVVYKLTGKNGPVAAKFFKNPDDDRERRYEAISKHLKRNKTGYTVGFNYHVHGIYVNGAYFPTLLMEWVEGKTLGAWVDQKVAKKDCDSLRKLADEWVKLIQLMQRAQIGHGDLQHGNVMVVKDKLRLVDYDGMYVPELRDAEQVEHGVDAYQHQERALQRLGPDIDHFSAWVILISLRALAADLSLHAKYKKRAGDVEPHENLLFIKEDVQSAPGDSNPAKNAAIWRNLRKNPDPDVREWSTSLWECLDQPFDQVPPFAMDPYGTLRSITDWDEIARLSKSLSKSPPADLKQKIETAQKRVDCRNRLKEALAKGSSQAIRTAYNPELLDDWPECKELVRQAKQAEKKLAKLQDLESAATAIGSGDGQAFVVRWDAVAGELAGVAEAERFRKLAEEWRARIKVGRAYLARLGPPGGTETQIAAAWRDVERYGAPHPSISEEQRRRGKEAVRRAELIERLNAVPDRAAEDADKRLEQLWDESLLGPCIEVKAIRRRVDKARERLAFLADLRSRIAAADSGGEEAGVIAAAKKLPAEYLDEAMRKRVDQSQQRIEQARKRQAHVEAVRDAIRSDSDRAIKAAWEKGRKELAYQVDRETLERCELAVKRCELMARLDLIEDANSDDFARDEDWERLWRDEVLGDCDDARAVHRPRRDKAVRRLEAWRALEEALGRGTPSEVRSRKADPLLEGYPPVRKQTALIAELVRKADDVDRIMKKLLPNGTKMPLAENDLAVLRESPELFDADARRRIEDLISQRLLGSLKLSAIDEGYEVVEHAGYIVLRWTWPDFVLISRCLVDVSSAESGIPIRLPCSADNHRRNGGGMKISPADDGPPIATIWPAVNVGWKEILGQPLRIGPIDGTGQNGY